jgi:glycerophosphoryl diester phosphodiesterase
MGRRIAAPWQGVGFAARRADRARTVLGAGSACLSQQHRSAGHAGSSEADAARSSRLAQTFSHVGLKGDTCTASRINPPEHPYLENTLDSMRAAFAAGADIVEFDVHPTTDGHFAVFHDWTLDCRTEGKGVTREHTLADLEALDVGYGYTADGGKTYPFRGKGVGLMPSLDDVLAAFPERRFLIHIKSNDASEGDRLADRLARLPQQQLARLMVYGGDLPVARVRARLVGVPTMSRASLKSCVLRYFAVGWTGYVPEACGRSLVPLPHNYARWLWGWPNRMLGRMGAAGTEVFVLGALEREDFSRGIDDALELRKLPPGYRGGIWTNRIDRIAPLVGR